MLMEAIFTEYILWLLVYCWLELERIVMWYNPGESSLRTLLQEV